MNRLSIFERRNTSRRSSTPIQKFGSASTAKKERGASRAGNFTAAAAAAKRFTEKAKGAGIAGVAFVSRVSSITDASEALADAAREGGLKFWGLNVSQS